MNCRDWEERIALYVGGDATPAEAAEVERHVGECAGCQVFASGMKQSMELLHGAHEEPLDAAHYAAVRARVITEIERGRAPWWRRAWVYGLVASAVVVLVLVSVRPAPRRPREVARVTTPPAPALAPVASPAPSANQGVGSGPGGPPHIRAHRRPNRRQPAETVLVKLETDNPDVVIYWIAERKGDLK